MAYTFIKLWGNIGNSLCENERLDSYCIIKKQLKKVTIHLPADSIIADKFDANANVSNAPSNNIPDGWMGLDIGQLACDHLIK
jgi:phosphoglycerate kinase